jgi:hypothetical protein
MPWSKCLPRACAWDRCEQTLDTGRWFLLLRFAVNRPLSREHREVWAEVEIGLHSADDMVRRLTLNGTHIELFT